MSVTPHLPDDPEQCQRLLLDLLSRNDELRRQAQDAQQQADRTLNGRLKTPDAASLNSNACLMPPPPITANCKRNTPNWPRSWRDFAAMSSDPAANDSSTIPARGISSTSTTRLLKSNRPRYLSPTPPSVPGRNVPGSETRSIISHTIASNTTCPRPRRSARLRRRQTPHRRRPLA